MAADLLLYNVESVVVGKDQIPHIDYVNTVIKKLNKLIKDSPNATMSSIPFIKIHTSKYPFGYI